MEFGNFCPRCAKMCNYSSVPFHPPQLSPAMFPFIRKLSYNLRLELEHKAVIAPFCLSLCSIYVFKPRRLLCWNLSTPQQWVFPWTSLCFASFASAAPPVPVLRGLVVDGICFREAQASDSLHHITDTADYFFFLTSWHSAFCSVGDLCHFPIKLFWLWKLWKKNWKWCEAIGLFSSLFWVSAHCWNMEQVPYIFIHYSLKQCIFCHFVSATHVIYKRFSWAQNMLLLPLYDNLSNRFWAGGRGCSSLLPYFCFFVLLSLEPCLLPSEKLLCLLAEL